MSVDKEEDKVFGVLPVFRVGDIIKTRSPGPWWFVLADPTVTRVSLSVRVGDQTTSRIDTSSIRILQNI